MTSKNKENPYALRQAITSHSRLFDSNRYVYPVVSRRSRGVSIGINLNPDKICNFDCIYCQVDRTVAPVYRDVDEDVLFQELESLLEAAASGELFSRPPFNGIPVPLQRVNDIAFSGDGEPTTYPGFREVAEQAVRIRDDLGLENVKVNVITNCTRFHRPHVQDALETIHRCGGEIWAKLDAGTSEYYDLIERTRISFDLVVQNLLAASRRWPLVIQSLFMRVHGEPPPPAEIEAFAKILRQALETGGALKLVQIYTVARPPAESYVTALSNEEVDFIAAATREHLGEIPVEVYYGA